MSVPSQPVRLHLGCGRRYLPGWVHIDLSPGSHIDYQTSIENLSMFKGETVAQIYCSHALEYFDRNEVIEVLHEWRRVLAPEGTLHVAVPDFQALIRIYEITGDLQSVLGPLYGRMTGEPKAHFIYHRTVFDYKSLTSLLRESGFKDIVKFDPISFLAQFDPNYDDHSLAFFPHMDRSGVQVSLCLKAKTN